MVILKKKPDDLSDLDIHKKNYNEKFKSDLWINEVISVIDLVINKFVELFSENPYLHRCESSIHCELYNMLINEEILNEFGEVGGYKIRLVHKEWPEYLAREDKGERGKQTLPLYLQQI